MKHTRILSFLVSLSLVLCLIVSAGSVTVYAANEYDPDQVFGAVFDSVDSSIIQLDKVASYTNDLGYIDLGYITDNTFFLLGASYKGVEFDYGSYYTFSVAIQTSAAITITDSSTPKLYSTYLDTTGTFLMNGSRNLMSNEAKITDSGGVKTITFNNLQYEDMAKYWNYYVMFEGDDFGGSYIYLLDVYFGLSSEFSEEAFANQQMEKLDDILKKLQEIFDAAERRHTESKSIWNKIKDGILNLPSLIADALKGLIDSIVETVIGSITGLMDGFIDDLKGKLGILYQAPDYFVRVIQSILITDSSNSMTFPQMKLPVGEDEYILNEEVEYQVFPDWIPEGVYTFLNMAMSIIVIFAVINYAQRKWDEITNNG